MQKPDPTQKCSAEVTTPLFWTRLIPGRITICRLINQTTANMRRVQILNPETETPEIRSERVK